MQPKRDTKAESNRRSKVCEVLASTGISRCVKMERAAGNAPLDLGPEASASLLGYALKESQAHRIRRPAITSTVRGLCRQARFTWEMDEHQGIVPRIPVWKTGVYLSTPMLD